MSTTNTNPGALTEAVFYILLSLLQPLHGYGIMQFVKEISQGRVELGPGTLYGALNTMLERGWIEYLPSADRKKEYIITARGRTVLADELDRLRELLRNGEELIGGQTRAASKDSQTLY